MFTQEMADYTHVCGMSDAFFWAMFDAELDAFFERGITMLADKYQDGMDFMRCYCAM